MVAPYPTSEDGADIDDFLDIPVPRKATVVRGAGGRARGDIEGDIEGGSSYAAAGRVRVDKLSASLATNSTKLSCICFLVVVAILLLLTLVIAQFSNPCTSAAVEEPIADSLPTADADDIS